MFLVYSMALLRVRREVMLLSTTGGSFFLVFVLFIFFVAFFVFVFMVENLLLWRLSTSFA